MSSRRPPQVLDLVGGGALFIVGAVGFFMMINLLQDDSPPSGGVLAVAGVGLAIASVLMIIGVVFGFGMWRRLTRIGGGKAGVTIDFGSSDEQPDSIAQIEKAELAPEEKAEKQDFASKLRLPTIDAPPFQVLTQKSVTEMGMWPGADASVPMYTLDKNYRILDWNYAFSLAFDRSMEGLRGQFVTEWVYHMANWEEILRHGEAAFADPDNLPRIDVEPLRFVSKRYNGISATKRAYQVPGDDGDCIGWLAIMELNFDDDAVHNKFSADLLHIQRMDLLWSEYSLVYDKVLTKTRLYEGLVGEMLEGPEDRMPIEGGATVLDLGAGSGNLTRILGDPKKRRTVVAVENNQMMLNLLKWKCRDRLTEDTSAPGVIAIKQDILSLYGLDDEFFDYVVANNVFYTLGSPEAIRNCLNEVYRVLKPSGELRLSGPKKDTNIKRLFRKFEKDLRSRGEFAAVESDFKRVEYINTYLLSSLLYNLDTNDMKSLLEAAGFTNITYETDKAYGGEAMIIFAKKNG